MQRRPPARLAGGVYDGLFLVSVRDVSEELLQLVKISLASRGNDKLDALLEERAAGTAPRGVARDGSEGRSCPSKSGVAGSPRCSLDRRCRRRRRRCSSRSR